MDKENVAYLHSDYSVKNEGVLPSTAMWMHIKGIKLNEINQTAKDKVYVITNMWNLKQI